MSLQKIGILLLAGFLIGHSASVNADELTYIGEQPTALKVDQFSSDISAFSYEQIRYILDSESRVKTVREAIDLKTRGLVYVQNLSEFEYLTSVPFASPSAAYLSAVGDFIANNVGRYVRTNYDLRTLRNLESRLPLVNQAMQVKRAGLSVVRSIDDFLILIPPALFNPSEAYRDSISNFVAQNINLSLSYYTPIYLIVEAEKYTRYVNNSMAVKRAGLIAVHSQRDLLSLAQFSVPNPSEAYRQAVNDFIRQNISNYP